MDLPECDEPLRILNTSGPEFGSGSRTDVGKGRGPAVNAKHLVQNGIPSGTNPLSNHLQSTAAPISKILPCAVHLRSPSPRVIFLPVQPIHEKYVYRYTLMKPFMIFDGSETMIKFRKFCHTFVAVLSRAWRTQPPTRQSWPPQHAFRTAQHGTAWPPWLRVPLAHVVSE